MNASPSSATLVPGKCPDWFNGRKTLFQAKESVSCEFLKHAVAQAAFAASPLSIAEIGSRGGSDPLWSAFANQRINHAFEPGRETDAAGPAGTSDLVKNIPLALWKKSGPLRINLPRDGENASVFRPNLSFFRRLPRHEHMKVRKTIVVPATTLDKYASSARTSFDVLSLDVQGAELAVLQGAVKQLKANVMAVIAEVAFVELYEGQPRFKEIDGFLEHQGFTLYDLDLRRWEKCPVPSRSPGMRGQIIYGDALYFREPMTDPGMARLLSRSPTQARKFVALAELLGAVDLAVETVAWLRARGKLSASTARQWTNRLTSNQTCAIRAR